MIFGKFLRQFLQHQENRFAKLQQFIGFAADFKEDAYV